MGEFVYGSPSSVINFDDRVLAHLKMVILAKVRRGESFSFSWEHETANESGPSTIWIHPANCLRFNFQGSTEPRLNRAWIDELVRVSNTPAGLRVTPEPPQQDDLDSDPPQ